MVRITNPKAYGRIADGYWYCGFCGATHSMEIRRGYPGSTYPNLPSQCKKCKKKTIKWLEWHKKYYKDVLKKKPISIADTLFKSRK